MRYLPDLLQARVLSLLLTCLVAGSLAACGGDSGGQRCWHSAPARFREDGAHWGAPAGSAGAVTAWARALGEFGVIPIRLISGTIEPCQT